MSTNIDSLLEEEPETQNRATAQAEAVRQYLKEHPVEESDAIANDLLSEEAPASPPQEPSENKITLTTDTTFMQNGVANQSITSSVTVKDVKIEITEDDKEQYMKALLLDVPVTLDIPCYDGKVRIRCRALSVYEINVSTLAGNQFVDETKDSRMAALLLTGELQKVRVAMQVTHINEIAQPIRSYKFNENGTIEEHAKDIRAFANNRLYDVPEQKWNLLITALNVFEHKLRRLNELSIAGDFIVPLG